MKTETAGYLILYGVAFLILGRLAWWLDPEHSIVGLLSGVSAALLSALCGVLGARGVQGTHPLALGISATIVVGLGWAAALSWMSVKSIGLKQLTTPALLVLMAAVAAAMIWTVIKNGSREGTAPRVPAAELAVVWRVQTLDYWLDWTHGSDSPSCGKDLGSRIAHPSIWVGLSIVILAVSRHYKRPAAKLGKEHIRQL